MSRKGPTLCKTKDGGTLAKFNGRVFRFGRDDDPESRVRFARFKAKWEEAGRKLTDELLADRTRAKPATPSGALTIEQLRDRYVADLKERRPETWLRNNLAKTELSLQALVDLHGSERVANYTAGKLLAVRRKMVAAQRDDGHRRLCRREVNERVSTIKRMIRWAVAHDLAPPALAHGIAAVDGLREGERGTREGREVGPVDRATVDATLPYLSRPLRALVECLWWTGARPSELRSLRPQDIDRTGDVWRVDLSEHKTARHGKRRAVFFGPEAQRVLRPLLLRRPTDAPLFSPKEAVAELRAERRRNRKTKLYDSHVRHMEKKRKKKPKLQAGEVYDARGLGRAIDRAIEAANRDRRENGLEPLARWTPYQLRHAAATRIAATHGIEVARALLSHGSASMTEHYAALDAEVAARVMGEAG